MLTHYDLAILVKKMRDAQTKYFKTRNTVNLEAAFALEKKVDQAVDEILNKPLFENKDNG